jgi:predicted ester cyclase
MRFSDFWRVRDGRLAENWVMIDVVDVLRQLGVEVLKDGQVAR